MDDYSYFQNGMHKNDDIQKVHQCIKFPKLQWKARHIAISNYKWKQFQ